MSTLRNSLLLLLSVGVAAPAAALPRGPAAAWPGVSDVLLNVNLATPFAASPQGLLATSPVLDFPDVLSALEPAHTAMWGCSDQNLQRLVAEFAFKDGTSAFTSSAPPGAAFYQKFPVDVPDGCDTLYVTFAATTYTDYEILFTCKVDFAFCNDGTDFLGQDFFGSSEVPAGWVALMSFHDFPNGVSYTWCTPITPGSHGVELRMAVPFNDVFAELDFLHVYIDASYTGGGCVAAAPVEDPSLVPNIPVPKLTPPLTPKLPSSSTSPLPLP